MNKTKERKFTVRGDQTYDLHEGLRSTMHIGTIKKKEFRGGWTVLSSKGKVRIDIRQYKNRYSSTFNMYTIVHLYGYGERIYSSAAGKSDDYIYNKQMSSLASALRNLGVSKNILELCRLRTIDEALTQMYVDIFGGKCVIISMHGG